MACCTRAPWTDVGVVGGASSLTTLRLGWIAGRAGQLMRMLPSGGDEDARHNPLTTALWLCGCLSPRPVAWSLLVVRRLQNMRVAVAHSPGMHAPNPGRAIGSGGSTRTTLRRPFYCGAGFARASQCHARPGAMHTGRLPIAALRAPLLTQPCLPLRNAQANSARYCRRNAAPAAYSSIYRRSSVATRRYLRASALVSRVARNSESLLQFGQVRASASCWPRA